MSNKSETSILNSQNLVPQINFRTSILNSQNLIPQIVFVLGCKGMLGNYVYNYLKNMPTENKKSIIVYGVDRQTFDVCKNSISVLKDFIQEKTSALLYVAEKAEIFVINCIGLIPQSVGSQQLNIDTLKVENNYIKINSVFPQQLATMCDCMGFTLIHVTTDCVFSGQIPDSLSYSEDDLPDDTTIYGRSKSLGEPEGCLVIRTSIIGEEINHRYSLLEWLKSNSTHNNIGNEKTTAKSSVKGFKNHLWNGITCYQCAKIIGVIINEGIHWTGTRHIFSPEPVSKCQLLQLMNDAYNLGVDIEPFDAVARSNKTLTSIYDTSKNFEIPPLKDQIEEMYRNRHLFSFQ
jgi:dTDP-4-dehydrorhamnose reductase